jgi:hypothetical protein
VIFDKSPNLQIITWFLALKNLHILKQNKKKIPSALLKFMETSFVLDQIMVGGTYIRRFKTKSMETLDAITNNGK